MIDPTDFRARAREIVDANRSMTLAAADGDGVPWASPVWYAPAAYREFSRVSSPEAAHSRNLAVRSQLAIEIFSRRSVEQGFPAWTRDDVLSPARHRLYRATVSEAFILDPHDQRHPVTLVSRGDPVLG